MKCTCHSGDKIPNNNCERHNIRNFWKSKDDIVSERLDDIIFFVVLLLVIIFLI